MVRRLLLGLLGLAGLVAAGGVHADAPAASPQVTIDTGTLVGAIVDQARVFKAIPYAAPPVGPLRWRPPRARRALDRRRATPPRTDRPVRRWSIRGHYNDGGYAGPISEDCLTLDVFAPLHAAHAPVMVWIFGGGNVAGADSIAPNDGRFFARDGVILVAMNYRLGALGFFAHPALTKAAGPGEPLANYGLMDQIAALKWVKRNIAAFGGDPDNVTIFGESAGGENVLTLMVTPAARAACSQKATVQSGGGWGPPVDLATGRGARASRWARSSGCRPTPTAQQLRALPGRQAGRRRHRAGPVVDGRLVTETAAQGFARGHQAPRR